MKSINTFITEARTPSETILYFPNLASWFIYEAELSGQISDGYWENARPATHWRWLQNVTIKIDDNKIGYEGHVIRRNMIQVGYVKKLRKH